MATKAIYATAPQVAEALTKAMRKDAIAVLKAYGEGAQIFKDQTISTEAITKILCDTYVKNENVPIFNKTYLQKFGLGSKTSLDKMAQNLVEEYRYQRGKNFTLDTSLVSKNKKDRNNKMQQLINYAQELVLNSSGDVERACAKVIKKLMF